MPEASDIASRLTHPAVQALLMALLSTALVLWRRRRAAVVVALLALAWIWIASTPLLALRLREGLATMPPSTTPHADAIVVLGGGKVPAAGDWAATRTRAARGLTLWRDGYAPLLMASGSDQAAQLTRGFALSGVPESVLRAETTSVNTHENAANSARLLKADGLSNVLLVTSAVHMRRAADCFRHEGIGVVAVPAEDTHARLEAASAWLPRRDALTLTARCLHEYVALWVYQRRGWI